MTVLEPHSTHEAIPASLVRYGDDIARWTVTIPTLRHDGLDYIRGQHIWVLAAPQMLDATHQALARASTPQALRRRRGADIDYSAITVTPWQGDGPLDA
ncbi:hypothetical protein [Streptomyces sp. BK340]|uniref:hypothetical protein n=1 Tax=Streptomyces sp. BK340 TaxID=2572903 RepID=UPI0011A84EEA|nr:hypothetical protein [Streptomyces sp. BK340]